MSSVERPEGAVPGETIGGFDRTARIWVFGLFALGGAAAGVLLPYLARLAGDLPWMPFEGPIRLVGSFGQPWLVWGRPLLGLALGLAFAGWVVLSSAVLYLTPSDIRVERRGEVERVIERRKVDAVYRRGSRLVIETKDGRRLFDDDVEGDKAAVREAFARLGYPWEGAAD